MTESEPALAARDGAKSTAAGRPSASRRGGGVFVALIVALAAAFVAGLSNDKLGASLASAIDEPVTYVVFGIVAVLGLAGVWLRVNATRAARLVVGLAEAIEKGEQGGDPDALTDGAQGGDAVAWLSACFERADARAGTRQFWAAFKAGLVVHHGQHFKERTAADILKDHALDDVVVARWPRCKLAVPYSFAHELPGFMVGLGMLGTFIGISIALGQLVGQTAPGSGGDQIITEIGGVVTGLASAFWTSIAGLIASSLTTWRNHKADSALDMAAARLAAAVDAAVESPGAGYFMERQVVIGAKQLDTAKRSARLAKRHLREMREVRRLQEDANTYLSTLAKDLGERLGESLGDTLRPMLEAVTVAVQKQVQDSAAPVKEMFVELTNGIVGSLDSAVGRMGQQFEGFVTRFEGLGGALEAQLQRASSGFADAVTDAGGALNASLTQAVDEASVSFDALQESVTTSAQRVSEQMRGALGNIGRQVEQNVSRMRDGLGDFTGVVTRSMAELGAGVQSGMSEATATMVASVRQASTAAASELESALTPLREGAAQVAAMANAVIQQVRFQHALVEEQGKAAEQLRGAVAHLAPEVQKLASFSKSLQDAVAPLLETTTRLEALKGQLGDSAKVIQDGLARTTVQLAGVSENLALFQTGLEQWVRSTGESVERFGAQMGGALTKTLGEYDSALARSVKSLEDIAMSLVQTSEEIGQRVEGLTRKRSES